MSFPDSGQDHNMNGVLTQVEVPFYEEIHYDESFWTSDSSDLVPSVPLEDILGLPRMTDLEPGSDLDRDNRMADEQIGNNSAVEHCQDASISTPSNIHNQFDTSIEAPKCRHCGVLKVDVEWEQTCDLQTAQTSNVLVQHTCLKCKVDGYHCVIVHGVQPRFLGYTFKKFFPVSSRAHCTRAPEYRSRSPAPSTKRRAGGRPTAEIKGSQSTSVVKLALGELPKLK